MGGSGGASIIGNGGAGGNGGNAESASNSDTRTPLGAAPEVGAEQPFSGTGGTGGDGGRGNASVSAQSLGGDGGRVVGPTSGRPAPVASVVTPAATPETPTVETAAMAATISSATSEFSAPAERAAPPALRRPAEADRLPAVSAVPVVRADVLVEPGSRRSGWRCVDQERWRRNRWTWWQRRHRRGTGRCRGMAARAVMPLRSKAAQPRQVWAEAVAEAAAAANPDPKGPRGQLAGAQMRGMTRQPTGNGEVQMKRYPTNVVRRPYAWLGAGAVAVGIGAALATGSAVAWADDGQSARNGNPAAPTRVAPPVHRSELTPQDPGIRAGRVSAATGNSRRTAAGSSDRTSSFSHRPTGVLAEVDLKPGAVASGSVPTAAAAALPPSAPAVSADPSWEMYSSLNGAAIVPAPRCMLHWARSQRPAIS